MALDLTPLIPGLAAVYEAVGDPVTFSRPKTSSSSSATTAPWNTYALFEWDKSVVSQGAWIKATVIYVAAVSTYTPKENDTLATAGGRSWKVAGVKPHAVGMSAFGWAVQLGAAV